ncbi:ABC transporter permease [Paenibacillus sp. NEAU-GSW1]|uniref:ABC transporter permease n=1 Tax=Paenibacillus sp. NEAU-GSW1 TaxID=2682486 RepID=UPI0012E2E9D4|nr:ABC transporter permease [Paenibacillus sp. NEAU-GSW1]MUT67646.1 ABC transporter permease subunit [Paenibacillus sp. NEAU-GSW1]
MYNFALLVQNENMKIYRRPRAWVMIGILLLIIACISIVTKWTSARPFSMWELVQPESIASFMLITVFTTVIAAGSVADEFTAGTIKLLVIRPWTRTHILLSKYISVLLFALFQTVLIYLFVIALNALLFGYDSSAAADAIAPFYKGTAAFYFLKYYAYKFISLVVSTTLAFMISAVFRSGALAIGIALFIILIINTFIGLIAMLDYTWVDYLLFIHLDLVQYLNETPFREGMTLGYSLSVLAVYYVIFIALTWYVFNKRDIAA